MDEGQGSASPAPGAGPAVERRIVSVLFADLVGFTSLSESLDAEDVAAVQDAYFAVVRETIARYGGRLEKFIGDAAMAAFGVPRGRDDDAERAVRAGLALVSAVEQLGARLSVDLELQLRVGINTGEVAYAADGPDTGRVTGDTVNVAARLQTAAEPGSVLIGPTTMLATAETIEARPVAPLHLKGKAEPVQAAMVVGPRPERSRAAAVGSLRAPTIGRERELAALRAALRRVGRGGAERWLVMAPPGVGKSRLLEELASDSGATLRQVRLAPEGLAPLEPVAGLLRSALASAGRTAVGARQAPSWRSLLQEALAAHGTGEERMAVVLEVVAGILEPGVVGGAAQAGSAERERSIAAWLDALDALAGRVELWLIEDVHWAGADLLAFLGAAGERPGPAGRLVVATARPSLGESAPDWCRRDATRGVHRIDLAPLRPASAAEAVDAMTGGTLPRELVAMIVARADGTPLFLEELLRTWAAVGVIEPEQGGGGWRLTVPPSEVPLPTTVQALYAAQLDDLPSEARLVATRASVAGRRFPVAALEPLGVADPLPGLAGLNQRALVRGPFEDEAGEAFAYRHALLRDVGYASLARAERARLHVALARWQEAVAGDHATPVADRIGLHYAAALESAPGLAAEVAPGLGRGQAAALAAGWLERAAQHALGTAAYQAATELMERALSLTPDEAILDRARRETALGRMLAPSGGTERAMQHLQAGRAGYAAVLGGPDGASAREGYSRASAAAAALLLEQLRFRDGAALASEALGVLGGPPDLPTARLELARIHADYYESNDARAAAPAVERVLQLAVEEADQELELRARRLQAIVLSDLGEAGLETFDELAAFAMRLGEWPAAVGAMLNASGFLLDGRFAELEERVAAAARLADARGLSESVAWAEFTRAEAALASGEWDAALEHGFAALDVAERHGYARVAVRTWSVLGSILKLREHRAGLARMAAWFEGREDFPDSPYGRLLHGAVDVLLAPVRGLEPYVPDVERLRPAWSLSFDDASTVASRDRIFEAWQEAGLGQALRHAVEAVGASLQGRSSLVARGDQLIWQAALSAADGDATRAIDLAREALTLLREGRAGYWLALTLRLLERLGAASKAELDEAERLEARLGAPVRVPLLDRPSD
ncbi:MAG TPA: adenylate/guanylate cyclase domain-containing protein [Candidatus Limnocylindrales bacterium]|nr:adenylate/guanylate cyclase domain-containing protein [Candidatus Limnocylindrales bacterium]